MRITLVISSLTAGGAQRVMTAMANYWVAHDREVTLITLTSETADWYTLHPRGTRVGLNLQSASAHFCEALRSNLQRIIRLRHELQSSRPDVVISFLDTTNVLTLMANWGLGFPVIVSERSNPCQHHIGKIWNGLRTLLYRRAAAVVVQTSAVRQWASRIVGKNAIHVIPNPVNSNPELDGSVTCSNRHGVRHNIVAVGRLVPEKGFDLLIKAFERCAANHTSWSLVILGEGREHRALETLAADLGIADRVSIPGAVRDPFSILRKQDLFVLSSRFEGFPNVLLEAMACGVAVIAADCPSGPRDIIRDGLDGVLVRPDDVDALAAGMDRLMADDAERQRLGANAVGVVERFSTEKIMNTWDEVVTCVCRKAGQ